MKMRKICEIELKVVKAAEVINLERKEIS